MKRIALLAITHALALATGFALGVYLLPILTAPASPDAAALSRGAEDATYRAELTRDLRGSDFLHWGQGTISVGPERIVHEGENDYWSYRAYARKGTQPQAVVDRTDPEARAELAATGGLPAAARAQVPPGGEPATE